MLPIRSALGAAAVASCFVASASAQSPSAPQLWTFPGRYSVGLADNGAAILGTTNGPAFRWTFAGGLHDLEDHRPSTPERLSRDGSTLYGAVSGNDRLQYTINDSLPFVYNHSSSLGGNWHITAVNGDGTLATVNAGNNHGYVYTRGGTLTPVIVTDPTNVAQLVDSVDAMSRSGRFVAGNYNPPGHSYLYRLDRQTNTTVTIPLPPVTPGGGEVRTISDDGSVMFMAPGSGGSPFSASAYRWTEAGGYQALPFINYSGAETAMWPNTHERYSPTDATANGGVVVGGVAQGPSFIWDAAGGMRVLQTELASVYGLDLTGRRLSSDVRISADGHWLMGGYEPTVAGVQGGVWIAYIPSPGAAALLGLGSLTALRRRR